MLSKRLDLPARDCLRVRCNCVEVARLALERSSSQLADIQLTFESAGALGLWTNTRGLPSQGSLYCLRSHPARMPLSHTLALQEDGHGRVVECRYAAFVVLIEVIANTTFACRLPAAARKRWGVLPHRLEAVGQWAEALP